MLNPIAAGIQGGLRLCHRRVGQQLRLKGDVGRVAQAGMPPGQGIHVPAAGSGVRVAPGVQLRSRPPQPEIPGGCVPGLLPGSAGPPHLQAQARPPGWLHLPDKVQVRHQPLRVPRSGWWRLKGSNLYAQGQPVQARIRQEGTRARPKWYAYLTFAVPAGSVRAGAATGVLGLDRNVGQVTDSDGDLYPLTDMSRLDSKIARKQRLWTPR